MSAKRIASLIIAAAVLIGWPWLFYNPYFIHIGVLMGIMTTLALSINLMLRIGQLSVAHAAFMGLGAYGSALLVMRLKLSFWVAAPLSGFLVGLLAAALGPILLRVKGVYFVLLTFALGQVINLIFQTWIGLFGGNNGLYGIPKTYFMDIRISDARFYYLLALALAAATFFGLRAMYRSEVGAIIDSIEENEELSKSLGIDALRYRIAIFGLSAFLAGLSGGIYAHYLGFLSPPAFSFWTVVNVIVINVIGGIQSPTGVLLGAILLVPLPELLRDAKEYQVLVYGLLLIAFLLFLPRGLAGLWSDRSKRWLST